MNNKNIHKLKKFIEKYYSEYNKPKKFVAGKTKIPLAVPPFETEEIAEALESLLSKQTTMSKKVEKFEINFSKYIGNSYSLMVNSGSSANLLALSILTNPQLGKKRIQAGDEVITPAVTWATTVYPITNVGAIPNFVDVKLEDYNIDVDKIESAITKKTKALMIVHLLGCPCNIIKIKKIVKKHNLWLIEDSCEAHGARYNKKHVGTFGDLSTFSFFASHHITTMEGGMVSTNDKILYEIGKSMRTFGWIRNLSNTKQIEKNHPQIDPRFLFFNLGYNFRPTELQGAFGIHQLRKLEKLVNIRIYNAKYWNIRLSVIKKYIILPELKNHIKNSFLFYPLTVIKNEYFTKNDLVNHLEKNGIETRPVMTGNMVEQPVTRFFKFKVSGKLVNAEYIMRNSFVIGNHHEIDVNKRKFIADTIIKFVQERSRN